jgi:hypothetical protein
MNTALACTRATDLERLARQVQKGGWGALRLERFRTGQEHGAFQRLLDARGRELDDAPFLRLYFGHEACEHLVPSFAEWDRVLGLASRLGLGLSAVLPPTYAAREDDVGRLLDRLAAAALPGLEVVCAEWGTVALVREHPGLAPVLGRLANRMKRLERWAVTRPGPDVRNLAGVTADGLLAEQVALLRRSPLGLGETRARLAAEGVAGIEFDPVPQGLDASALDLGPLALHAPWTYVTSGRACVTRALVEGGRPSLPEVRCPGWCRTRYVLADQPRPTASLVQKGNAVYQENVALLSEIPASVARAARWVIRPFL